MPDFIAPEDEEQEIVQTSPSALAVLAQSEHAAMVQTANLPGNKRKLAEFESRLMSYATHSQPIALQMFYSLPRGGKQVIGPSIRFAEITAPAWKNCAVAARVMDVSDTMAISQGIFIDYEQNLRNAVEVPRRITDKDGRRYGADMIVVTMNAAMSVARRNAVLKGGVPQALWTPAYEAAMLTAVGKANSHAQRVADAMEFLHKLGLTEWQILNSVGVPSVRELETEHLLILRVLVTEIKRGDKSIEEVFGSQFDAEIISLFSQLKMNQTQQTMFRNSYMGRPSELASYLREKVGTPVSKPAAPEPKSESPAPGKEGQGARSAQIEKNFDEHGHVGEVAPGLSGEPINKEPFKPDPLPNANAIPYTVDAEGKSVRVPPLETDVIEENLDAEPKEPQATPPPIFDEVQPAHRRGRLSNAEKARRAAAAQGNLMPELPASEAEARQQVEDMVEQTDQFAF
jgi:hypothetical protein